MKKFTSKVHYVVGKTNKKHRYGLLAFTLVFAASMILTQANPDGFDVHKMHSLMNKATAASFIEQSLIPRSGWTATATSEAQGHPAWHAIDNNQSTFWHNQYEPTRPPKPHEITVDMKAVKAVGGISYIPRQDGVQWGNISKFAVATSLNNTDWNLASIVTTGHWGEEPGQKYAAFKPINARYIRLYSMENPGSANLDSAVAEFYAISGTIAPPALPRTGWTASASSVDPANPASNVLDGNGESIWHSRWATGTNNHPYSITIDMKANKSISALSYLPRQDIYQPTGVMHSNGRIGQFSIHVSTDGTTWGSPVASGTWSDTSHEKIDTFTAVTARYVRLTANTEAGNRGPWASAGEIQVHGSSIPAPSVGGKWDDRILNFPLVPASAVVLGNNKLLTFAGYDDRTWTGAGYPQLAFTRVSIFDLNTNTFSNPSTVDTDHQMFCSGIALLSDGRVLIDGGSDDKATTIYNPYTNAWSKGPQLNIARAYQGDTPLSTGQVLTLGGSWSDSGGNKNGEVFTPSGATGSWALKSGITASAILTADPMGVYRADNHAWLFGTSNGNVFHAGPSKRMNWISTSGNGSIANAGNRGTSADAMNGNAVMYDVNKIITFGGGTSYGQSQAHRAAYKIDIAAGFGQTPTTSQVGNMNYQRSLGHGVVLPDGKVLAVGGMQYAVGFIDTGAVYSPELWDPATGNFSVMAPHYVPRTYHSVALLLPDGRVFAAGGGLCGTCTTNHANGEFYSPPYLFNANGTPRTRPVINTVNGAATPNIATPIAPGATVTVNTNSATPQFALVRTAGATHSVNNDQRRIPLAPTTTNGTTYTLTIPSDRGVVLPGNYMLFAMNGSGTPSIAKLINIR